MVKDKKTKKKETKKKSKPRYSFDKKGRMRASTKFWIYLILIYLALGTFYHLNNPTGEWTMDLLTGGFQQIKLWFFNK